MYSKHITELIYGIWSIDKEIAEYYLSAFLADRDHFFSRDTSEVRAENRPVLFSYDDSGILVENEFNPSEPINQKSVAVIKINGVMSRYDKTCGPEGTESHLKRISRFATDPNVSAIVLSFNSPGGESTAANHMVEQISLMGINKPILAYVEDMCASAAYWVASACNSIGASGKLSVIGSIGTYTVVRDFSKAFEEAGVKIHEIYATKSTEKNIELREALKGNYEKIQSDVDFYNEHFINSVIQNRPVLSGRDEWKTGKKFYAEAALKNNLIDYIAPFNVFIESILQ